MNVGVLQRRAAKLEAITTPKMEETVQLITRDMDALTASRIYQDMLQPQGIGVPV